MLEMVLAHTVSDKVEAAYRRTDLFERRRRLMAAWATFCTTAPAQEPQSNQNFDTEKFRLGAKALRARNK
jgi:hypothetical protein